MDNNSYSVKPPSHRWIRSEVLPSFIRSHFPNALKAPACVLQAPSSYNPAGRYVRWYVIPVYALGFQRLRAARSKARSFRQFFVGLSVCLGSGMQILFGNILAKLLGFLQTGGMLPATASQDAGGLGVTPRIRFPLYTPFMAMRQV